jgi:hypothetical protein
MKDLMAMIRQIGVPTFFLTLSAAETKWPELLKILYRILKNEELSDEMLDSLNWEQRCELIRQDPVTCSRYFDHRIRQLFKLLKSKAGPFDLEHEIIDTYLRVEFQSRGSPHVHCLLWLKDAPIFDPKNADSFKICEQFIDKYITFNVGSMGGLEEFQFHRHRRCRRGEGLCLI